MRQYKGFSRENTIKERERLPIGGYVLKILEAKVIETNYGERLLISFDIAEGEYKDFFANDYKNQMEEDKRWKGKVRFAIPEDDGSDRDAWVKRRFNTFIVDLEDSNPGYAWNWDEKTLEEKKIGGLFNNKEYEINGKRGFYTNCKYFVNVERIKKGNFKIPADDLLQSPQVNVNPTQSVSSTNGFMSIPDGIEDEGLPFN